MTSAMIPGMQPVLSAQQITSLVPDIDEDWATLYEAAINSIVYGLTGGDPIIENTVAAQVELLLITAVRRSGMAKPWLKSETAGPFSVTYQNVADDLLTAWEWRRLRALLGLAGPASSGARGRFPQAMDYSSLDGPFRRSPYAPGAEAGRCE